MEACGRVTAAAAPINHSGSPQSASLKELPEILVRFPGPDATVWLKKLKKPEH
jgi:hypothetical protein